MNIIELHDETWQRLNARRQQMPHALLMEGMRGIGKSEFARAFAESLLCECPTEKHEACNACMACGWLAQGNHPDFRLIQPEALAGDEGEGASDSSSKKKPSQQITIDQIRALDDFLHVGTHRQGLRVVLINPAEAMNRATANALLKALEEPIASTLFILVTSDQNRLLPTIRSRCQSIVFVSPGRELSTSWLADAGVDEPDRWLALAGGAPVAAAELASSDERVLLDALIVELSRGSRLDPLVAAGSLDRIVKADKRPAPLRRTVDWTQKWLFDLTQTSMGMSFRYFVAQQDALARLAKETDVLRLLAFARKAIQYKLQCEQPLNSRLFLEDFFMSYAALFQNR